jgi:sec-independent protein translocase protein TatA
MNLAVPAFPTHAVSRQETIMGELFTPTHLIVLAVVAVVLFGGKKLPELGKGLGEGLKGFKDGMKGIDPTSEPTASTKLGETAHLVTPTPGEDLKPPTV